ncbi:GPP34 family phosphoprotein [Streptomyces sp. NPDC052107]|uniref:GPP34 family phosphoprotein n=1 Tax=Streptomyces sp. NPDC052107 TaxID=3155632 RepID=UPI003424A79B
MTSTPLLLVLCGAGEDGSWPWRSRPEAGRAVVGAALFELAVARRLELSDDRVVPYGGGLTHDTVPDEVLRRVGAAGRERPPWEWVESLGPGVLRLVEEECAGLGTLGERVSEARARVRDAAAAPDGSDASALAAAVLLVAARQGHLVRPAARPLDRVRRAAEAVALLELVAPRSGHALRRASAAVRRSIAVSAAALAFLG